MYVSISSTVNEESNMKENGKWSDESTSQWESN